MTPGRLLVAGDCEPDRIFLKTLERELGMEVDVFYIDSTDEKRSKRLRRHLSYMIVAVKAFAVKDRYSHIIFWQQFIGFYYGLLTRFSFRRRSLPMALLLPLIYKKRIGALRILYRTAYAFLLSAPGVRFFICHSSSEREAYIKEFGHEFTDRMIFVRYGVRMPVVVDRKENLQSKYFFSGGTSNRDYGTLLEAFSRLDERLKIACYHKDVQGLIVPPNVDIIHNIFKGQFLALLEEAAGIILPLSDPSISAGQLVLLDAMRLGKPVIVTRSSGTEDYVGEGEALLIEPRSAEAIREAVANFTHDRERAEALGRQARLKYENNFTVEKYAERISALLKNQVQDCAIER